MLKTQEWEITGIGISSSVCVYMQKRHTLSCGFVPSPVSL